jgi:RNA polymerase sigma-70 factor (ECF subfamily)
MIDQSIRDAWQALADRLRPFLGRRLPAEDVDDALQDVLVRIHRGAAAIDDATRFGPWVYTIARHVVIDRYRRSRPDRAATDEIPDVEAPPAEPDASPLVDCIAPFVARLDEPYRHAITLVELNGLTQAKAAEMAGVSLSGMKSRVQRGRRQLRAMLEACCRLTLDGRGHVIDAEPRTACSCGPDRSPTAPACAPGGAWPGAPTRSS